MHIQTMSVFWPCTSLGTNKHLEGYIPRRSIRILKQRKCGLPHPHIIVCQRSVPKMHCQRIREQNQVRYYQHWAKESSVASIPPEKHSAASKCREKPMQIQDVPCHASFRCGRQLASSSGSCKSTKPSSQRIQVQSARHCFQPSL